MDYLFALNRSGHVLKAFKHKNLVSDENFGYRDFARALDGIDEENEDERKRKERDDDDEKSEV